MSELIERHFDEYTINISKNRLLIKQDSKGKWIHYQLRLEVDERPDVCVPRTIRNGVCEGCGADYAFETYCQCWVCDYYNLDGTVRPHILMWADPIDAPDESVCVSDEFCDYILDTTLAYETAEAEYGDKVEMHGVRHANNDWTLGVELTDKNIMVDRVGWVFSIPKPTEKIYVVKHDGELIPKKEYEDTEGPDDVYDSYTEHGL